MSEKNLPLSVDGKRLTWNPPCVYWNTRGEGVLRSWQAGRGYVIGTRAIKVETSMSSRHAEGTAPEDTIEGIGRADSLRPQSLYEFQRRRRSADAAAQ